MQQQLTIAQHHEYYSAPPVCTTMCGSAASVKAMPVLSWQQQIKDFFSHLFGTVDFPARWHCGNWTDFHGILYITSDLLIWLAYFTIPFLLYRLLRIRKDIPFHRIFLFFIGFILLCGLTHLIDALIFWWPVYRFSALVRLLTALVSITTVYQLYHVFPQITRLRSISELEQEIQKRRQAEEELAKKEFLLSEAGRIAGVGGWEIDLGLDKRVWSDTIFDILEIPPGHDIHQDTVSTYYPEPFTGMLEQAVMNAVQCGKKWDMEVQAHTFKGKRIWVRHIGEPVFDHTQTVIKLRGIVMRIDQYKKQETELVSALNTAKEKQHQLENFSYLLSHNIRNHTSNLMALTQLISPDELDTENNDLFVKTKAVVNDLQITVGDIGNIIQARIFPVMSQIVFFDSAIRECLANHQEQINTCKARVTQSINVSEISFPKTYLTMIIDQLFANALRYRSPDRELDLHIKTYMEEQRVVLEVSDNGLGIDLDKNGSKLFNLYSTFSNHPGARGVGLYLIKAQLESQDAEISVISTLDKGTQFKIYFKS
jgi:signal transduction histidine kinase